DEGVYFPFRVYDKTQDKLLDIIPEHIEKEFVETLCDALSKKKLIAHNGVFDIVTMYHRYGINLTNALYADTILMKHTIDEERPFGLKELAEIYKESIGFTKEEAANQEQLELKESVIRNGGRWTKEYKDIYKG